jgi:hypothetical protein
MTGRRVFVFGSNLAGRHGKGAALTARREYGAVYGVGEGRTGDAYAIPTKDRRLVPRALDDIRVSVDAFIEYARLHPDVAFLVTRVGCGLAGYSDSDIAPMFRAAPSNCTLPDEWSTAPCPPTPPALAASQPGSTFHDEE